MSRLRSLNVPVTRVGIAVAAMAGAVLSTVHCGGGDTGGTGGATGSTTGSSGTTTGGSGGGTGGSVSVGLPKEFKAVGIDMGHALALDATLSNDGSIVYFTGVGPAGPGVFSI